MRISLLEDVVAKSAPIFRTLDRLQNQQMKAFAPMRGLIGQAVALGAGYFGATEGMSATAGAAIEFETAFADVKKVVEATDEQFENMRRSIRRMSGEIPLAATDIAALFAAAGESGVATEDLQSFAEMAARVGVAFDMTAADAGESLAKLKTQLGLNVAETGEMADAINHLSNNMASKAKDVTEFMLRVGAIGEMSGFVKEDVAAMGSAMIAAGSDASTAGTAMKNVIRALARGDFAKKSQRDAAKALGLHLPSIAKDMQKDAKGTMRKVLTAIAKAPKHQQTSLLSEFFGDEASAFMPLVGNIKLLDDALASVADRTKYSGSAFAEYVQRANTTRNVLDLLGNKISNVFAGMGDDMLPAIREGAEGIGYVIDTLGNRVTILDRLEANMKGFMQGLGYEGGVRELTEALGDLLLGEVDPNAADRIGRIFMQAKEWGTSIRELNDAVKDNPIAKFLTDMSGYGFQIFAWGTGIAVLAGSVRTLAKALFLLSGAGTILSVLKTVGSIASIFPGGKPPSLPGVPEAKPPSSRPVTSGPWGTVSPKGLPEGAAVKSSGVSGLGSPFKPAAQPPSILTEIQSAAKKWGGGMLKGGVPALLGLAGEYGIRKGFQGAYGDNYREPPGIGESFSNWWDTMNDRKTWLGEAANEGFNFRQHSAIEVPGRIDATTLADRLRPQGTQDVRVVNSQPVNSPVYATFNITGVSDPKAAADAALSQLGDLVRNAKESSFSDE
ncbi:phage tail tape measure protein [Agrobacterium pusense]|uniref:phage tail tape measure protein n=1 Tax=Agrobacterium pusense TaxID=648995 RepID=UPI002F4064C2